MDSSSGPLRTSLLHARRDLRAAGRASPRRPRQRRDAGAHGGPAPAGRPHDPLGHRDLVARHAGRRAPPGARGAARSPGARLSLLRAGRLLAGAGPEDRRRRRESSRDQAVLAGRARPSQGRGGCRRCDHRKGQRGRARHRRPDAPHGGPGELRRAHDQLHLRDGAPRGARRRYGRRRRDPAGARPDPRSPRRTARAEIVGGAGRALRGAPPLLLHRGRPQHRDGVRGRPQNE